MRARRMVLVGVAYLVGAVLLDALIAGLVPLLVLPPLFTTLARGLLAVGFVVTLAAAWVYRPPEP